MEPETGVVSGDEAGHTQAAKLLPVTSLTIRQVISSLGFGDWIDDQGKPIYQRFRWPPDVFALAATILRDSGAYLQAVRPRDYSRDSAFWLTKWRERVERNARLWRRQDNTRHDPPPEVRELLDEIASQATGSGRAEPKKLFEISVPEPTNTSWLPYMQLLAIADQACRGIGLLFGAAAELPKDSQDAYPADSIVISQAMAMLIDQLEMREGLSKQGTFRPITLCKLVDPARAITLPKMRTSQRGVTIRSFSLHLALLNGTDVEPIWNPTPNTLLSSMSRDQNTVDSMDPKRIAKEAGPYNIILLPWPLEMHPAQFKPMDDNFDCLAGRPHEYNGFFSFVHAPPKLNKTHISDLISRAKEVVGPIHGLVLPEMSMTRDEFNLAFGDAIPQDLEFLACGVYEPPKDVHSLGRNYAIVRRRTSHSPKGGGKKIEVEQEKHHRWALDTNQIAAYSLGSTLRPGKTWWEGIDLPRRSLHFFALDTFSAFTVLICEDLARPDPVADTVRAVGPNLLICLLLDGPQLASRWSARYATVLADDPGSSVLTLSSLGMVKLSRLREKLHEESRVIALWRESAGATTELHLPDGADALVISLTSEDRTEFTLDGREDSGMAATLRLAGVHPIKWGR